MSLQQTIQSDRTRALKAKDAERLSTLRMLSSAITNKEIELRKKDVGLSDQEIYEVIQSEAHKRKDAIEEFMKGGRSDLVEKEKKELHILSSYLPPEMSDEELLGRVEEGIRETGARSIADFGNVMKIVMPIVKGKASGERVSLMVKQKLSGTE